MRLNKKNNSINEKNNNNNNNNNSNKSNELVGESSVKKPKEGMDILSRTGGAYIPPAKLRLMQKDITDKNSIEFQRISWEALKKSINGLINKVNVANIAIIVRELFKENLIRGRGLLCRSIISAQTASPTFTHVYATLVAITNTKVSIISLINISLIFI
jgi:pre-mRNA-splicing factor CWC22